MDLSTTAIEINLEAKESAAKFPLSIHVSVRFYDGRDQVCFRQLAFVKVVSVAGLKQKLCWQGLRRGVPSRNGFFGKV